jgi:adenylate kinase family enzyme
MANRILVIGSPGSGKSIFARKLGERTGLPVHHLDQIYWRAGWVESEREAFRAEVERITAAPHWIIDGNYSGTLETRLAHAGQVILLDLSPLRCTWRILKRVIAGHGKVRPDMAEGCPERFDLGFLWYVLSFRLRVLPRVEAKLEGYSGDLVWLGTPREVTRFLSGERLDQHIHE